MGITLKRTHITEEPISAQSLAKHIADIKTVLTMRIRGKSIGQIAESMGIAEMTAAWSYDVGTALTLHNIVEAEFELDKSLLTIPDAENE